MSNEQSAPFFFKTFKLQTIASNKFSLSLKKKKKKFSLIQKKKKKI